MNWEAIGAVGEVLGAIGVIVTLGYLAVQVRRSNSLATAESHRHSYQVVGPSILALAENADLAKIFTAGLADRNSLSDDDRVRFDMLLGNLVGAMASSITDQIALDIIGGDLISDHKFTIRGFLSSPGGLEWWNIYHGQYPPAFQRMVIEEKLAAVA
jgi:hypothetical protein